MFSEKIKTLSLFSGAGGLDIGFHDAGFEIVACVELESAYCKTLLANRSNAIVYKDGADIHCVDIREFDPSPYQNMGIECIIGGPPCQTFSAAGRRSGGVLGTEDQRGRLFESYCRILESVKPKVFVFENVYGLPSANNGGPWREICASFSKLGYQLEAQIVDSADYGVPQHRERLIIVGVKKGSPSFTFPLPTHGPDADSGKQLVSVFEAIQDLQNPDEQEHELGGLYGHLLPMVPEGLNYSFFTREMGYPKPYFAWRSKFSDFLYKADRNAPCRTLKAQPGKFTGPFHWKNRHFTVDELKRIQTFPDNYVIEGTFGKAMEQIGNSVPPRLAYVIATSVREQVLRPQEEQTFQMRPMGFQSSFRQRQRDRTNSYRQIAAKEIEARFPNVSLFDAEPNSTHEERNYFVGFEGFFNKKVLPTKPSLELGWTFFKVDELRSANLLEINIRSISAPKREQKELTIRISGLTKYLINLETVVCTAHVSTPDDVFRTWSMLESSITRGTQFFTLIDIYGHYANRGDTVNVKTAFSRARKNAFEKSIEYVGNSENCGDFVSSEEMAADIGTTPQELDDLVAELRSIRWDVRTQTTHPTIRNRATLCTYPFPLLSDKAQLERRLGSQ